MNQVGVTTDGKKVVDGVFFLLDSIGLPLDIIVEHLKGKNIVPAWDYFILDARQHGWKDDTIFRKLEEIDINVRSRYER